LPTFNAIIDGTDFADKVTISFAVKETAVAALSEKITEMSGGRDALAHIGERFDYR
jgi:putative IMPACT (imprinted ancient) family translation regulator